MTIARSLLFLPLLLALPLGARADHSREIINPATGYSQAVAITAGAVKTIYISGQIGEGDDLESQLRSVYTRLGEQLRAAGAGYSDIVKTTTYIVDYRPEDLDVFRTVRKSFMGETDMPASTLVGVQSLALPAWRVEIEAIAIVDATPAP